MDRIIVRGGRPLEGRIRIGGAKNSALKLMAASLLTEETLFLENMPDLADVRFMAETLSELGVEITKPKKNTLCLKAETLTSVHAPYDLVRKMRATFNVLGPLIAREGKAKVSLPGGCAIGTRPVDLHLKALSALGAEIHLQDGYVTAYAEQGLKGAHISFPFISVGATEHAMLSAILAEGETILDNVAREPEIKDLAECLKQMGAQIEGAGESQIRIQGVKCLKGTRYSVIPDRIQCGTYAIATAITGGRVVLEAVKPGDLTSLWTLLEESGVRLTLRDTEVLVEASGEPYRSVDIETYPYPGFPTDLQAQFMALMTVARGVSVIHETIFENRFMHVPELSRMGADINITERKAIVRGREKLFGAPVMATDLRASVSLIIAGLKAEGETIVNRVYHLDRGFEALEEKLQACGADIERSFEK